MVKKYLQDWYNNNEIIRHIAKTISYGYGKHSYNAASNNCEHLVNRCVFNIDSSPQADTYVGSFSLVARVMEQSIEGSSFTPLEKMRNQSNKLDSLTSNYSYEKERIENYISQAENNRSYTRSKYQIEQEKFQERIVVYPKDWCRVQ